MLIRINLEFFEKQKCPSIHFLFCQNFRYVSNVLPCLKTMELYEYLLLLSSFFSHIFYFIFSAPISFSLYFPICPSLLLFFLMFFLKPVSNIVEKFLLLNCVQHFAAPWIAACLDSLPFTISLRLLKLMSIESVMPSTRE